MQELRPARYGLPYLTLFVAALMAFHVVTSLREGVMEIKWLGESHQDKDPAMFWFGVVFYTFGTVFLTCYAISDIASGR